MCIAMKTLQFLFKNSMKNRSTKKSLYDIHIYLGNYWVKMLQEAQWKNMVETDVRSHSSYILVFFSQSSLNSNAVYEVFYRWMSSLSNMQAAYPDGLTSGLVCSTKQKKKLIFLSSCYP